MVDSFWFPDIFLKVLTRMSRGCMGFGRGELAQPGGFLTDVIT
jgi:hypothetical protein